MKLEELKGHLQKFDALEDVIKLEVLQTLSELIDESRNEAIEICSGTSVEIHAVPDLIREVRRRLPETDEPSEPLDEPFFEKKSLRGRRGIVRRMREGQLREGYFVELLELRSGLYDELRNHLGITRHLNAEDLPGLHGFHCTRIHPTMSITGKNISGDTGAAYYYYTKCKTPVAVCFSIEKTRKRKGGCDVSLALTNLHTNERLEFMADPSVDYLAEEGIPLLEGSDQKYCLSPNLIATKLHELSQRGGKFAALDPTPFIEKIHRARQEAEKRERAGARNTEFKLGDLPGGIEFMKVCNILPLEDDLVRFVESGELIQLMENPELCTLPNMNISPDDLMELFSGSSTN